METKTIRAAIAAQIRKVTFVTVALCAATASARSLIHYFDFDTPSGSGLAYTGVMILIR